MFNPFSSAKRLAGTGMLLFAGWWTFLAPMSSSENEPIADDSAGSFDHQGEIWARANGFRQWARSTLAHYTGEGAGHTDQSNPAWKPALRIGTMNITDLSLAKYQDEQVANVMREFGRQCDLVAVQGLQANQREVLVAWIAELEKHDLTYDYLIGPVVGRGNQQRQFAFIYNKTKLETDPSQLYTLQDPQDLLTFDPLIAWFRVRGVDPTRAFTFSLANLELTDPALGKEQGLLPDIVQSIRNDGRREDDIILIGSFECAADEIRLCHDGWFGALGNAPTDPSFQKRRDNILLNTRATEEFRGNGEVFDFLRAYNLTVQQAISVSQHLPAWGEFSALEGGYQ